MAKTQFTEVTDEMVNRLEHPSDYACRCEGRDPNDHLLNITEGSVSVTHVSCGKELEDDGYVEMWGTSEPIPVRVDFVDLGMSASTPDGPAEHNGFWWEIAPHGTPDAHA